MTQIDSLSSLSAIIRAQLDVARRNAAKSAVSQRPVSTNASPKTAAKVREPGLRDDVAASSLEQKLLLRVSAIHVDDPQRQKKAFRLFLETVLLDEFGSELQADAGFSRLVDQVVDQMNSDQELHEASLAAADLLLSRASRLATGLSP